MVLGVLEEQIILWEDRENLREKEDMVLLNEYMEHRQGGKMVQTEKTEGRSDYI